MEMLDGALRVGSFLAVTLGIIVLFAGKRLNDAIGLLREPDRRHSQGGTNDPDHSPRCA